MPCAGPGYQRAELRIQSQAEIDPLDGLVRVVMETDHQTLAAAGDSLRLAADRQEIDLGEAHLAASAPALRAGEQVGGALRGGKRAHVRFDDLVSRSVALHAA